MKLTCHCCHQEKDSVLAFKEAGVPLLWLCAECRLGLIADLLRTRTPQEIAFVFPRIRQARKELIG